MQFMLCKCGAPGKHGRFRDSDGNHSRPLFSKEAAMRWLFVFIGFEYNMPNRPVKEGRLLTLLTEHVSKISPDKRQLFEEIRFLIRDSGLPERDQEAWDSLPERDKTAVRTFHRKGFGAVNPMYWPGAFGTKFELASIQGTNPPNNPEARCNIHTMLYAQTDFEGATLDR